MTSTSTPAVPSTFSSGAISPQEVEAVRMSLATLPSHPPSSEELKSRAATPRRRKKPYSRLSNTPKANVHATVRTVLDKGHTDYQEYFCLITGFSNYDRLLNYPHIVPGPTPSDVVSLLVDTWFMLPIGLSITKLELIWDRSYRS